MNIRELLKKHIGNQFLIRKILYCRRWDAEKIYQQCFETNNRLPIRLKVEMEKALFVYGCAYDEYYFFDFYHHKDKQYRKTFITDALGYTYFEKLNRYDNLALFDDKYLTYRKFLPYYRRKLISFSGGGEEFDDFLKECPVFMAKVGNSSCGSGIEILNANKFESVAQLIEYMELRNYDVCEELIIQSEQMSRLHPASVNTIRMTTIVVSSGENPEIVLFHPFLKIGQQGNYVDNGGKGGIIVKIDEVTGKLCTDGCDEANHRYKVHPNTGIKLRGYQLPDWEQAKELAKKLALVVPENRYIGWDLAHTNEGWVMVEGNARGQFVGQQMCDVVGKRREFEEIIKRIER